MRHSLFGGLVVAALILGLGVTPESVVAQGKDKDKAAAKDKATKDKDKAPAKAGTIEIGKGKDGKFRFTVRDADGKFMAMSAANTFATVEEAKEGIEKFKEAVAKAKVVMKDDKDDK